MDPLQDIRTKTGGAYIPPNKLRLMQQKISDKNCEAYQRLAWESLKKGINGLINKVNVGNIAVIVKELFAINLIRGRGILCRSILKAQSASPTFTHVYAALMAVCNTKFPKIGELLLKRLVIQFRRSFQRNDKSNCINTTRFIAHLVNQNIAHELLALEILVLLLENATNDSVEVAIAFLKECGSKLEDVSRKGVATIFERLRNLLHDGELNKRVQYMIEVMFAIRKDKFKDHPIVLPELDLIEENDQFTHLITLEDDLDSEDKINVFSLDPNFQENESKYEIIKNGILDGEDNDEDENDSDESSDNGEDDDEEDDNEEKLGANDLDNCIIDNTETNLITLRKTIYLTIQSSLDFEECAHKLLKLEVKPSQVPELCNMIVDCCAQQRTYIKFFGLLAQRFCMLNPDYVEPFKDIFKNCYDTIHRFETCKLRNVGKLFAHLFHTDAIPWTALSHIKLNEEDTTSSSRVFIKILFQQLAESLGLVKLNARIKDPTLDEAFTGLFPRDNPQNTRFAINFFTSIGLGGLTDDLREHLKTAAIQKPATQQTIEIKKETDSSSSSSESSSDSSSDSSSSDTSSDSSDSDSSSSPKKRKRHSSKKSSKHNRRHDSKNESFIKKSTKRHHGHSSKSSKTNRVSSNGDEGKHRSTAKHSFRAENGENVRKHRSRTHDDQYSDESIEHRRLKERNQRNGDEKEPRKESKSSSNKDYKKTDGSVSSKHRDEKDNHRRHHHHKHRDEKNDSLNKIHDRKHHKHSKEDNSHSKRKTNDQKDDGHSSKRYRH